VVETVLAAVRTGPSKTEVRDYPMPDIPEDAALMKTAAEELSQASHKLAEAMYAKASRQGGAGPGAPSGDGAAPHNEETKGKDDVVDADFEEVKG